MTIANMTTNATQIILAVGVAVAATFPSPQDAKSAFLDVVYPDRNVRIETSTEEAVFTNTNTPLDIVVTFDPAAECLYEASGMAREALSHCIEQLYRSMEDNRALPNLAAPIFSDFGNTHVDLPEAQRRALSEFCRALWTINDGQDVSIENPGCASVVQGVEHPA